MTSPAICEAAEPTCPLCMRRMSPWLDVPSDWRRPGVAEDYRLYFCGMDKFGMLWPRPEPERIPEFYNVAYYTHGQDHEEAYSPSRTLLDRLRVRAAWQADRGKVLDAPVLEELIDRHGLRVCDIGCGNGTLLALCKSLGCEIHGVEPDAAARAEATRKGLNVLDGTAEKLPAQLDGKQFDVVLMSHVLEHCLEPVRALKNVKELLAPQGVLVCEVPNNEAWGLRAAGPAWHWLDVPRHLNFFTARSLRLACIQAGLNAKETVYAGFTRQFDVPWITAEQEIHARLGSPTSARVGRAAASLLLLRTLCARPSRKYDSVRVHSYR